MCSHYNHYYDLLSLEKYAVWRQIPNIRYQGRFCLPSLGIAHFPTKQKYIISWIISKDNSLLWYQEWTIKFLHVLLSQYVKSNVRPYIIMFEWVRRLSSRCKRKWDSTYCDELNVFGKWIVHTCKCLLRKNSSIIMDSIMAE